MSDLTLVVGKGATEALNECPRARLEMHRG